MKPPPFTYHAPNSVSEALALLRTCEGARVLAGGQSLMPMMNMRYAQPEHVVDINNIEDLAYIHDTGDWLEFGALTRQREIEFSPLVAKKCPVLRDAILYVGHRQTRNRGTIGGSLCHLDPAAEIPLIAALYDARITVIGADGSREVPFSEFALGFMTSALRPDEMVTAVKFPTWAPGTRHGFSEFARRHGDFAMAAAAVVMSIADDGRVTRVAIAIGGVAPVPTRLREAEEIMLGQVPSSDLFERAGQACNALEALDDAYASATYRRHLAGVMMKRALAVAQRPLAA